VACFNVADADLIPVLEPERGRVHLIDWQPARAGLVARSLRRRAAGMVVEPRITIADGCLGRAARFATRVEEMIACASDAGDAIARAHDACRDCVEVKSVTILADQPCELVVTVLGPLDEAYACFAVAWGRRFGLDLGASAAELERLRARMLDLQLEGHARALRDVIDSMSGSIELVAAPCEVWWDHGWFVRSGVPRALEVLGRYFSVDRCATRTASRSAVRLSPRC